jgi:hypothetical protein
MRNLGSVISSRASQRSQAANSSARTGQSGAPADGREGVFAAARGSRGPLQSQVERLFPWLTACASRPGAYVALADLTSVELRFNLLLQDLRLRNHWMRGAVAGAPGDSSIDDSAGRADCPGMDRSRASESDEPSPRRPRAAHRRSGAMSPEDDVQQHQHDSGYTEHPAHQVFAHGRHLKLCATRLAPNQQCVARRRRRTCVGRCAAMPRGGSVGKRTDAADVRPQDWS